jgi:hypothetical protein
MADDRLLRRPGGTAQRRGRQSRPESKKENGKINRCLGGTHGRDDEFRIVGIGSTVSNLSDVAQLYRWILWSPLANEERLFQILKFPLQHVVADFKMRDALM